MTYSMTAFSRLESRNEVVQLTCEIRSLNHRFLETNLRLPEELRPLEPALRDRIGKQLARGKVDLGFRVHFLQQGDETEFRVNDSVARGLFAAHAHLRKINPEVRELSASTLLQWPGLIEQTPPELKPLHERALALAEDCIVELKTNREREGTKLAELINGRLAEIDEIAATVRAILPSIRDKFEEKLRAKLQDLTEQVDPARLEQEIVIHAQKFDIDEELDRLQLHTTEMRACLTSGKPIGRRLDFLTQELHREANTLGSKSLDARTSKAGIDLKVLIEQIREQVQNIE